MKVFVNGCFDVLHIGHIRLLEYAKSLGDELVVAIDTDERVRVSKGSERPINNLGDRKEFLGAIKFVDNVLHFSNSRELEDLIQKHEPDFLVVGSDWRGKKVVGEMYAKQVIFFERIHGYSSTSIIKNSIGR
tara:strand:- start:6309 stop:6704 length:396 start_codon:yes stop_codon:yes gene_type:complete